MLIQLLLPTIPFFAHHSATLLAKLYMTIIFECELGANAPCFRFGFFCIIFAIAHAQKRPQLYFFGKMYESIIKLSLPVFVLDLNFCEYGRVLTHFGHFRRACAETAIKLFSV